MAIPGQRVDTNVLLTRSPLSNFVASYSIFSLDLHVLGAPLAFILSQDQTLLNLVYCFLVPTHSFLIKGFPSKIYNYFNVLFCLYLRPVQYIYLSLFVKTFFKFLFSEFILNLPYLSLFSELSQYSFLYLFVKTFFNVFYHQF